MQASMAIRSSPVHDVPAAFYAVELNGYPLPHRLDSHLDKSERAQAIARQVFEDTARGVRSNRVYALVIPFPEGPAGEDKDTVMLTAARGVSEVVPLQPADFERVLCAFCDRPTPPIGDVAKHGGRRACASCYRPGDDAQ
jgi:hypothetical protein